MKVVIDISESIIEHLKDGSFGARLDDRYALITAVMQGTPIPKGEWIPASERLPEENGRYLVTNSAWGAMEVDWNAWVNGAWLYSNTKPIAWMPIPEPYRAESEDEQ